MGRGIHLKLGRDYFVNIFLKNVEIILQNLVVLFIAFLFLPLVVGGSLCYFSLTPEEKNKYKPSIRLIKQ